jgi:hypothetical protein
MDDAWYMFEDVVTKTTGRYIGCFGQRSVWNIDDPITFCRIPTEIEAHYEKFSITHFTNTERNVFDLLAFWLARIKKKNASKEKDDEGQAFQDRERDLARKVVDRWKKILNRNKTI